MKLAAARADDDDMAADAELSVAQCRFIAAVRRRHPDAAITLHGRGPTTILEVRRGHRIEFARLTAAGRVERDRRIVV